MDPSSATELLLGWRDDVHALLKASDLLIRSSRSEGSGYVLEAFANGVPVVSAQSIDGLRTLSPMA